MTIKNQDVPVQDLQADENISLPQTEVNPELEEMARAEESGEFQIPEPIPQTGPEMPLDGSPSGEDRPDPRDVDAAPQTGTEWNQEGAPSEPSAGSEIKKRPGRPRKTAQKQTQSDTEAVSDEKDIADGVPEAPKPRRRRSSPRPAVTVLSIDERPTVETEADKAKNDLLDLLESQKTGRILTGTIQGVERPEDNPKHSFAVIYHGAFKVIIPAEEAVEPPADYRGRLPEDVLHYMLTKRLGAEVDYIVKGIDSQSGIAAASRLDAMRARRKEYYFGTDRDGNNLLYADLCAEARVVSVIRAGIFVDLFGLEVYIPLRELSYQRWMDAAAHFQPGQRILVKVLEVDRSDRNHVKAAASVKQAGENPYEKALRRYSVGNRYVGTVSMVDTNGVFVALDGGIDCLCSYPKRGRPPRGSRVTVRILGINHESNRIWGAITHIAAPR